MAGEPQACRTYLATRRAEGTEEATEDGRPVRMLTVIDEYTRECMAIKVARRIRSDDVIHALTELFVLNGVPEHIRSDNGPEFTAKVVRGTRRLYDNRWTEAQLMRKKLYEYWITEMVDKGLGREFVEEFSNDLDEFGAITTFGK